MHILIVRPGAIGDTLLTFPVIQALRAHYNNPHITLVSNPAVLPLAIKFGLAEEVSDYGQIQWSDLFASTGIQQPTLSAQLRRVDMTICWLRDSTGIVKHNLSMAGVKNVVVVPGRPPEGERIHIVDYLASSPNACPRTGNHCSTSRQWGSTQMLACPLFRRDYQAVMGT